MLKKALVTLVMTLLAVGCASDEQIAAENALALWLNKRPQHYTYVLQPKGWSNPGSALRIKVEQETLLEAIEADGDEPDYRRFTMTDLLQEAVSVSDESTYTGEYDAELGYVKSFFYAPGPELEPGGYGFGVLCFEPSLDESACAQAFQLHAAE